MSRETTQDSGLNKDLRLFPSIALRIPTAHNFTRDLRGRTKNGGFYFAAEPRQTGKSLFSRKRAW